ncbi:MAG: DUF362 domain-containing protein [Kofleriaceae bacterium]|nr:DUF362 domain-containing protein [Kofleriaceae bacterium]
MRRAFALLLVVACGDDKLAPPPPPPPPAPPPSAPAPKPAEPDSVSAASPAWTPGPAVEVKPDAPSVDGEALRAEHRKRIAADVAPVTMLRGGTPAELGQRLCEAVVPKRPPATPVLLKPNMGGFNWFKDPRTHGGDNGVQGRTTDPEFTRGVVKCLKARGHTAITIGDGFTGKAADWTRLARVSGYAAMAKEEGVTLVAFDDDGVFDVMEGTPGKPLPVTGLEKSNVPTLLMPKIVADHLTNGLFVSLPKLKTHRFSVFSVAVKGMQGVVMYSDASPAFRQKWRTHRELDKVLAAIKRGDKDARAKYVKALEVFAERMVDVLELEAPDAVLVEGAPAMDGDGFDQLEPRGESVAIGGTNPVLVDRVAAEYLGLWNNEALGKELGGHRTSPLLTAAARRFGVHIDAPQVIGDVTTKKHRGHLFGMAGFEIGGDPRPDLRAPKVERAPDIDGAIDAVWDAAPPLAFATDWAGKATKTTTRVRALWSPQGLYMLWELEGTNENTDRTRPTDVERVDLYQENCVELFLAPDGATRKKYVEIEVGPYGHWFDLLVDRTGTKVVSDAAWSSGVKVGTMHHDDKGTVLIEMAITAPEVLAALTPAAKLPVGLFRMEGKAPRQYLAAFPTRTPKPNFHVPDAFGTLVLTD